MPQVAVGAVASGVLAGVFAPAGVTFASAFLTGFATSMVLGGLSMALAPKPKKPQGLAPQPNTLAIRQPAETHKHVYGHTRIADVYAHMVGGNDNGKLHAFLILTASELTAVDEIWVDDYAIPVDWLDADGNVTQGRYANHLRIRIHLGSPNQAADSVAVSEVNGWTVNHRLRGIAYLYITMTKNQDIYPTGLPNFSAIVRGRALIDPRTNETGFSTNQLLIAYDYMAVADYGYLTDQMSPLITTQATICDEIVPTAAVAVDVESISSSILTLDGDMNPYQWGDVVRVSGDEIPSGLAADTDYYVIITQTKDTPRIRLATSLANCMASIAVTITSSGDAVVITKVGEPRYHGSGIIDTGDTLQENIERILSGMGGRAIFEGGVWDIVAAAYRAPDYSFDETDLHGTISVRTKLPMNERFNVIKGTYISSINNYQLDSYPVKRFDSFVTADGGVEYIRELPLPMTSRATTCQRIAKIEGLKGRQEIVFTAPMSMRGALVKVSDTAEISFDRYGWETKEFEVTGFSLTVDNSGKLGTSLTFRETDESVYDWESSEDAEIDPAPNSNLPSAFNVEVVTGLAYDTRSIETVGGDTVYALFITWSLHPNGFVRNGGDFEIQFKLSSELEYRPSFFVDGSSTTSDIVNGASINASYDIRIRARNDLGVRSNWSTIEGAIVGYSGGVTSTEDWDGVEHVVAHYRDWGNVADTATSFEDWGDVV